MASFSMCISREFPSVDHTPISGKNRFEEVSPWDHMNRRGPFILLRVNGTSEDRG